MKIPISATILLGLSLLAADPAAAAMRVGSVDFHTCQLGDAASIAAHCASLSVPLYRDRPDGEQIEFKLWLSKDVPGTIVKQVRTARQKGELIAETTTTLESYK